MAVALLAAPTTASASDHCSPYGGYRGYGSNYGGYGNYGSYRSYYSGPVYHQPSLHYDRVYHATPHYTPWRGWHTHGHYDTVPHYTPGHFDRAHGNHVHGNPNFHHD